MGHFGRVVMKRIKFMSVLLSITMCMSLISTPLSVFADEAAAPSESQSAETAESKETEASKDKVKETKKETEPSNVEETETSEEKETATAETSVTDSKDTEPSEKESDESKLTEPSKSVSKETDETQAPETTEPNEKKPAEGSSETTVVEGKIPSQSASSPKKNAYSGDCGADGNNLTWTYGDGTLTILGAGNMEEFTYTNPAPWYGYSKEINKIIISESVTSIGSCAFEDCSKLTSVEIPNRISLIGFAAFRNCESLSNITIPNSVTSISAAAFQGCSSLTSVSMSNGVTSLGSSAFQGCTKLTSITIPNGVKIIWSDTFYNCSNLTSIVIPDGLTSIGDRAFRDCSSLTSIEIPSSVTSIGDEAFNGCSSIKSITIPNGVTLIGEYAFYNCESLTNVIIPNTVTSIGNFAFSGCSNLLSINIPNSVTSIGKWAFYVCSSLTSVTISQKITSISEHTFCGCSSLTSINIPDNVTSIGDNAFDGCSSLTSINIPDHVTSIGDSAFDGCSSLTSITIPTGITSIGDSVFFGCSSLTSIKIPNNITSIGQEAFRFCKGLTSITIPNSVTSIGEGAFHGCISLTSITIPNSVTSIGNNTFGHCTSLTSITIPNSVTSIGSYSFSKCSNLTSINIPNSVTLIGKGAFRECTSFTDVYYSGSEDDWDKITKGIDNDALDNATIHYLQNSDPIITGDIAFENSEIKLAVGKKATLKATGSSDIAYKTSNKKIATVSATGVVTALKVGTATITAYSKSDPSKSATCTVTVRYKLTYVLNGGTNSSNNPEWYSGTKKLSSPTRTGYTFKGWYTSASFKKKTKVTKVTNANKTLYAKWELNTYKIRYNKNGGSGKQNDQSCKYGKEYSIQNCKFTYKGRTFVNWTLKPNNTEKWYAAGETIKNLTTKNNAVINLYANWTFTNYKITYSGIPEGVTNNNRTSYTIATPTFKLESPSTRDNYTFNYWYVLVKKKVKKKTKTVEQKVASIAYGSTGNKTIYAKWSLNSYKIKFNANGGTGKMDDQTCNVTKEYKIKTNAFNRKGWTFTGWNTKSDGSGASYANNQSIMDLCTKNGDSIVLYAQWKINEYTITYNGLTTDSTNNNKTTFTIETDTFELTAPSRPGYTFQYWYINVKKTKTVKKKKKTVTVQQKITSIPKGSTGNKTIYAKWSANKYNIIFQSNGGTGKMNSITNCVYGKVYTLPKNTFKAPEGMAFAGWTTDENPESIIPDGAQISNLTTFNGNNVTLYAKWIYPNIYTNGHSRSDAVSWVRSLVGQGWDYDHTEGVQCVDIVYKYIDEYLGHKELLTNTTDPRWGDAIEYANKTLPTGWSYVSTPQPGDIVIWDKSENMGHYNASNSTWENEYANSGCGHIGIVVEVKSDSIVTVEQNTYYAGSNASILERRLGTAKIYIRPGFNN